MRSKKKLIAVFGVLLALATIAMIWVGIEARKNLELPGKPVATLSNNLFRTFDRYQSHWLNTENLCFIKFPGNLPSSGAVATDQLMRFDTRTAKRDDLKELNEWVVKREAQSKHQLVFDSRYFSPDGKWSFVEEKLPMGTRLSKTVLPLKLRWIVSLDGKKRFSFQINQSWDRLEKWLPDSSGVVLSNMKERVLARDGKLKGGGKSQYCLKLENLSVRLPLPDDIVILQEPLSYSPDGKHRVGMRLQYLQLGNSTFTNEVVSAQLVIRNSSNDSLEFQGPKVLTPKHFVQSRQTFCIASPSGDRMLWVFEEDPLKRNVNVLLQKLNLTNYFQGQSKIELVLTDRDGSNVRPQPMITSDDFIDIREVQWNPDGTRFSYRAGYKTYLVNLN